MTKYKQITGFEDYLIYDDGSIFTMKGKKFLKQFSHPKGYSMVRLSQQGVPKTLLVHRLVASHFISNEEDKPQVNHIDGVKTNNHVSNLEWVTAKENVHHAIATGLNELRGEKHGRAFLKEEQIIKMRHLYENEQFTTGEIAKQFNVSSSLVYRVVHRQIWKHIA